MTQEEIESIIIELLAAEEGRDPSDLRSELEASGRELPCDSVMAAEVLGEVEHRCGVRLPMTPSTATAMRSVEAYAHAVLREIVAATSSPDQPHSEMSSATVGSDDGGSA